MQKRDQINQNNEFYKDLFNKYYLYLCRIALYYVGRNDFAQDVVQNVFISFWEKSDKGLVVQKDILPYLKGAVVNQSLKFIRDNRIITCELENEIIQNMDVFTESSLEEQSREELIGRIKEIVDTLPSQCKSVFEKIVFEEKRYKEIAEELHISLNSVKTQYARALKKIRSKDKLLFIMIIFNNIIKF